jgi:hypothetical protein
VKVALGLKAHSGWAALVALGAQRGEPRVVDRRRIELVDGEDAAWARQPYHAAEGLSAGDARALVERSVESARRIAAREVRAAVARAEADEHHVAACAVLVGDGIPDWSVEEILAVHFRMHAAEGELFRGALARAARACGLRLVAIPEKRLAQHAEGALGASATHLQARIATLGRSIGPPWARDQKDAALAALVALRGRT